MFTNDASYIAEVVFGPNLGLEKLEADVLHDQVDMDHESYIIYGKSEIIENNQRGLKYKERSEDKQCIQGMDILIAETIALLNRKGYITESCCQGHLPFFNDLIYQSDINDNNGLDELLERVKNGKSEIVEVKDNIYYVVTGTIYCWIRFDEETVFPYLPENFNLESFKMGNKNPLLLSSVIPSYYLDDRKPKKKTVEKSAQELMEMHENLKTWAYSLPALTIDCKDDYSNKPKKK